ncbi:MAG: hypothetical protein ABIE94_06070 [archaeon]
MKLKHPHNYGLMVLVKKEDYDAFKEYRQKLEPYVKFFMEKEFFDGIAPQHLSLCYFSYPKKYPEKYVNKLIPKIIEILKDQLPIKIKVKGLIGWWECNLGVPAILWNITDYGEILRIRKKIIKKLSSDIDHFKDENPDFTPHIGVALGKKEKESELKQIIKISKKGKEKVITLDSIFIFFPSGPKKIFPIE